MWVADGSSPGSCPACQLGLKFTASTVRKVAPVAARLERRRKVGVLLNGEGSERRERALSADARGVLDVGESRDSRSSLLNCTVGEAIVDR